MSQMFYRGVAVDPQIYAHPRPPLRPMGLRYRGASYAYPEYVACVPVQYELEYRGDHWQYEGCILQVPSQE
ncbi:hypothetical protein [Gloeobacter kilaueensis]|uniref:DUF4278 domain-containing protein n=1 Tax=Gloeobacter kilaueensis (strain ATCC BAA-2537 / CCAP 1431/1 / ULC 316 / JS1) TaxID=1183438 RepID=U5QMK9_GLOK1|nr:hypothetical protein [Gloeobacter kilaueensis]AGY58809.1 hypothetical protein GKIL_2563 [Gloeobacter kilaueensis JS1]